MIFLSDHSISFNPIQSRGGLLKAHPPPNFGSHGFYVGATLVCVDFHSQNIVQHRMELF